VHLLIRYFFRFFLHLGAFGLVMLGVLDSSFLFLPVGNDLLLVVLTARRHDQFVVYVIAASIGSALGVLLLDLVCRKGGEEGLKRIMSERRLTYLKKKMSERASVALMIAALAPPPFPFTAVVAAASAFQYPRLRLLGLVFGARAIRFSLIALAAVEWGRGILRIANSPTVTWFMTGFIALCVVGSTLSVIKWMRVTRPAM
jgi:membrane protein YqaA with SNARE-associated domain